MLIGLESPSAEVLELIEKKVTKEELIETVNRCKKHNIHGSYTLITGFPSVDKTHIDETLEFGEYVKTVDPSCEIKTHIFYPFKGSKIYDHAVSNGFNPPESIEDICQIDYYEKASPFISEEDAIKVRQFNLGHSHSVTEKGGE